MTDKTAPAQICRDLEPGECRRFLEAEGRDDCAVLDVRTPEEYRGGHLQGASNLDFFRPDFPESLAGLDRKKKYVVYCRKGTRGARTMELMRQQGFSHVTNIRGGYDRWVSEGHPVE